MIKYPQYDKTGLFAVYIVNSAFKSVDVYRYQEIKNIALNNPVSSIYSKDTNPDRVDIPFSPSQLFKVKNDIEVVSMGVDEKPSIFRY